MLKGGVMPRLEVDVDDEVIEGLGFAMTYWGLTLNQVTNMLLLACLAEWTKLVIAKEVEEHGN
jgi:hypothetical protein